MPPRSDPDNVGFLVADVTRLLRAEMDRRITAAGLELNPGDARTLSHAARCGTVRQNLLAERIGVEAMTVSSSLDRLEALGLIERQADSADRRAKLVHVTRAGIRCWKACSRSPPTCAPKPPRASHRPTGSFSSIR